MAAARGDHQTIAAMDSITRQRSASVSSQNVLNNSNEYPSMVKTLEMQLTVARNEIKELRELIATLQPAKTYISPSTDEEEEIVAKETAWLLPRNKKRRLASSPEMQEKSRNKPQNKTTTSNNLKKVPPPPIVLSNVANYSEINKSLEENKIKFRAKVMNNNQLKINVDTELAYRDLTKLMNETNLEWHTYENKQTRPIRVMLKEVLPTFNADDIKSELASKGYKIEDVAQKIRKYRRDGKEVITPLPVFMLTFHNTENIKKIYEIDRILNMCVKIEAIRNNKMIPQCKRCQRYGHTHKYCRREPTCVKCAGKHQTSNCNKPKENTPKCSNCGEAHPASYRGCLIAKELQKRRDNQTKKSETTQTQPRTFTSKRVDSGVSYAQLAQVKTSQPRTEQTEQLDMMQMLQTIMKKVDTLSERLDRLEAGNTGTIPKRTK